MMIVERLFKQVSLRQGRFPTKKAWWNGLSLFDKLFAGKQAAILTWLSASRHFSSLLPQRLCASQIAFPYSFARINKWRLGTSLELINKGVSEYLKEHRGQGDYADTECCWKLHISHGKCWHFFCLILFVCLFVSHEGNRDLKFGQAATVSRLKQLTTLLTLLWQVRKNQQPGEKWLPFNKTVVNFPGL